tara:strand:+ start:102 stop:584 length:483 start_codon:yes stop_codon:yes gene_type:complete
VVLCLLLFGCTSIDKKIPNHTTIKNGRILLVHSGMEKRAVKARFEWLESYEGKGKTIIMKVFDLWGNRLFETSKEFNSTDNAGSDWYFVSSSGNSIEDSMITKEILHLLKIKITREGLFSLLDDINDLIYETKKIEKENSAHSLKRKLARSEISVKIIFD